MCCGRGAGDSVPLNTHSITIGLLIVLYLNVYVRDLSETWALTLNILWDTGKMYTEGVEKVEYLL